jgi:hypothetical protein
MHPAPRSWSFDPEAHLQASKALSAAPVALRVSGQDLSGQEGLVICLGRVWKACQLQDMSNDFIFCENDLIRVFGGG